MKQNAQHLATLYELHRIIMQTYFQGSGDIDLERFIDSRANLTLIRLMVDPLSPECALNESDISLTKALYYDVFRIINGTSSDPQATDDRDRVSRSELRKQVKTVRIFSTALK